MNIPRNRNTSTNKSHWRLLGGGALVAGPGSPKEHPKTPKMASRQPKMLSRRPQHMQANSHNSPKMKPTTESNHMESLAPATHPHLKVSPETSSPPAPGTAHTHTSPRLTKSLTCDFLCRAFAAPPKTTPKKLFHPLCTTSGGYYTRKLTHPTWISYGAAKMPPTRRPL